MKTSSALTMDLLEAKNPNDFLARSPGQEIANVECIIASTTTNVVRKQEILSHYASLIRSGDTAHQIALEKYTRMFCVHLFQTKNLSAIMEIYANLAAYFPFYIGESEKSVWLSSYIKENNMASILDEIFKRTSYQIIISTWAKGYHAISSLPTENMKQQLHAMANNTLYSTHQSTAFQMINTASTQTGALMRSVPGLSWVSDAASKIAQSVGAPSSINTTRQNTLIRYEKIIETISQAKAEHMELLFFLYLGGNEFMQADVAAKIDNLIIIQQMDPVFLLSVLKTIAPEPLGLGWHAVNRPPDLLKHLSIASNKLLLAAAISLCNASERAEFQKIIEACTSNQRLSCSFSLTFSESSTPAHEWFAYLLSMGSLPNVAEVKVSCDIITHRHTMLLLSLMESSKLTISSHHSFHLASIANFVPQCRFEILCTQTHVATDKMIEEACVHGLAHIHIQLVNQSFKNLSDILSNVSPYTTQPSRTVPRTLVHYSFVSKNVHTETLFEVEISSLRVLPLKSTLDSSFQRANLLNVFLNVYSQHWRDILMSDSSMQLCKMRPIAIPVAALAEKDIRERIEQHLYLQLLVYEERDNNKNYLFDIDVRPDRNKSSIIKPGPLISTVKEYNTANAFFNRMKPAQSVQNTFLPSTSQSNILTESFSLITSHCKSS